MSCIVGNPCECGLAYDQNIAKDRRRHAKMHTEYLSGPQIKDLQSLQFIDSIEGFPIRLVTTSTPIELRRKFAHIAMVAQRTMPGYPAGYDGTITEDDQRLYIVVNGTHAIGMLLSALDSRFWKMAWLPHGAPTLEDPQPLLRRGPKIARVWVAKDFQRKGLAIRLVTVALRHLDVEATSLGWELPFSSAGSKVVQRVSAERFLGCCDRFTLRQYNNFNAGAP